MDLSIYLDGSVMRAVGWLVGRLVVDDDRCVYPFSFLYPVSCRLSVNEERMILL